MTRRHRSPLLQPSRAPQRGITLVGLLFWALLIGFAAYLVIRVVPTVTEYFAIRAAVDKIAQANPATVAEVRQSFERQREIDDSIQSVTGRDLKISKENDRVVVAFGYEKVIPLYGPVFLVIKYDGRSK